MNYYSTSKQSPLVDFRQATIDGQAPDKGLYFPEKIPVADEELITASESLTDEEIAFRVIRPYVGTTIPEDKLRAIVREAINFPIPIVPVNDSISSLELFHGPTLAFKDVGARFMSRCLGHFVTYDSKKVTVLVATSGDTGGAVAHGFYGVEGVDVVILYPSGKVSDVQEKQLTTLGNNIRALEIDGTFDDCQLMVKQAFSDETVSGKRFLTSANSINVARWLPQQIYYFLAWKQWPDKSNPPVVSVPSGNFGNICAGLLARQSGLPLAHMIAACNANDVVPKYMSTREFTAKPAVATLSNAMDVGNPSNFIRILELFRHYFPELEKSLTAVSITDQETRATIKKVFKQYQYVLDPHGAIGYLALQRYMEKNGVDKGLFLETAHPLKFPEALDDVTQTGIELPEYVREILTRKKQSISMKPEYPLLRDYLLS
ncbi:MAG: threonine synthase [Chitinophagaceae bacterium]|nr:threonine synthase [Chitinophagaceae bacterium]